MAEQNQQKTKFFKTDRANMDWYVFDASGKTLGRLASEVAKVLKGKHKPQYTPNADLGDGVIILNSKEVIVSGNKEAQKEYISHSGFLGGLKRVPFRREKERNPNRVIETAVKGMMPKTKLGRAMLKKLRIFDGNEHDLQAQKPIVAAI